MDALAWAWGTVRALRISAWRSATALTLAAALVWLMIIGRLLRCAWVLGAAAMRFVFLIWLLPEFVLKLFAFYVFQRFSILGHFHFGFSEIRRDHAIYPHWRILEFRKLRFLTRPKYFLKVHLWFIRLQYNCHKNFENCKTPICIFISPYIII